MINQLRAVGIHVGDQDRALEFYTESLGFELVRDEPLEPGEGAPRWIEVRPPYGQTVLVLFTPRGEEGQVGRFPNATFVCEDLETTYEELTHRGVVFTTPPSEASWGGLWAQFADPDGNEFDLREV